MHFMEMTGEISDLIEAYEKKFGQEYPSDFLPFTATEIKRDLEERLKDVGEPVPDEMWKPHAEWMKKNHIAI